MTAPAPLPLPVPGNLRQLSALAIFDDRVEVRSAGTFPTGIIPESLTRNHLSVQRNPITAEVFHSTGLIEQWGRGTNRVLAMCQEAGIRAPEFQEITGAAVVTFRARVKAAGKATESGAESRPESRPESSTSPVPVQYQSLEERILARLRDGELPISIISMRLGQRRVSGQLKLVLKRLLTDSLVVYTIPDKPSSRLQKYRLPGAGTKPSVLSEEREVDP